MRANLIPLPWIGAPTIAQQARLLLGLMLLATGVEAQPTADSTSPDWCATERIYEQHSVLTDALSGCPTKGDCDLANIRNANIPNPSQSFTTIRLMLHIVAYNDGSYPSTTPAMIEQQMAHLNQDYLPSRINFEYEYDQINATKWRTLTDAEIDSMKAATAVKPDSMLNIWISRVERGYSYGVFPWDPTALTPLGGVMLTDPMFASISSALSHEIGHCLGLWHTHHGVSEVTACSPCWERANNSDGDITGDFCEDTDPTPRNLSCTPPSGTDTCTGQSWGPTDVQNYMGYSGDECWSEFSPQQWGRMHCWINAKLRGWLAGVRFTATNTLGPVPSQVSFNGITSKNVSSWAWDFGDGQSSDQQFPVHTYTQPGLYDVSVHIESDAGPFVSIRRGLVWIYADTLWVDSAYGGAGQEVKVTIQAHNFLPVSGMTIPFTWASPVDVRLDSVSTKGLRTANMDMQGFLTLENSTKRAAFYSRIAGDGSGQPLAPGVGPVLDLYFRLPAGADTAIPIVIAPFSSPFGSYQLAFTTANGSYVPADHAGAISICYAGDVNNDDHGPDLSDLSMLIAYLQGSLDRLPNPATANVNAAGIIDVSDLSYLVAFLIANGPAPQCKL